MGSVAGHLRRGELRDRCVAMLAQSEWASLCTDLRSDLRCTGCEGRARSRSRRRRRARVAASIELDLGSTKVWLVSAMRGLLVQSSLGWCPPTWAWARQVEGMGSARLGLGLTERMLGRAHHCTAQRTYSGSCRAHAQWQQLPSALSALLVLRSARSSSPQAQHKASAEGGES